MKMRGFLALFVLVSAFIFLLFVIKSGQDELVVEQVKAFSRVKAKMTKANMASLEKIIVSFIAERGRAPKNLKELQEYYIRPIGKLDGWGTEMKLESLSSDSFQLVSAGPDGIFDTSDDIVANN